VIKMKDSVQQDQRITKELGRYRLASPSPGLDERVLMAARKAWTNSESGLHWTDRWMQACGKFRQEILALASAFMLILGVVMQLGGSQSVLADSMERLSIMAAVSGSLHRATSMECTVTKLGAADERVQYRLRWNTTGVTRVEMTSSGGTGQTLWTSNGTISAVDEEGGTVRSTSITNMLSKWKAAAEFLNPAAIAQHMERFGLRQADAQGRAQPGVLVLVGQENQQVVEIAINARTGLPIALKKYWPAPVGMGKELAGFEEVRFQWNKSIPQELFTPGFSAIKKQVH
jgi:hypothetical protein